MTKIRAGVGGVGFFFLFLCSLICPAQAAFYGKVKEGLQQLEGYKYPVYLYVPFHYDARRRYPFVLAIPDSGQDPKEHMDFWTSVAKRRSILVLVPTYLRPRDLPTKMDAWILTMKREMELRYGIKKEQSYLSGYREGAHYAAYFGTKYPEEFSAVLLIDGAWQGPFERWIEPASSRTKQLPFFVLFSNTPWGDEPENRQWGYRFEKKGYPVFWKKLEDREKIQSLDFKLELWEEIEERARRWHEVNMPTNRSLKEKIMIYLERFFQI